MPRLSQQLIEDIKSNKIGRKLVISGEPVFCGPSPLEKNQLWTALQSATHENRSISTLELIDQNAENIEKIIQAIFPYAQKISRPYLEQLQLSGLELDAVKTLVSTFQKTTHNIHVLIISDLSASAITELLPFIKKLPAKRVIGVADLEANSIQTLLPILLETSSIYLKYLNAAACHAILPILKTVSTLTLDSLNLNSIHILLTGLKHRYENNLNLRIKDLTTEGIKLIATELLCYDHIKLMPMGRLSDDLLHTHAISHDQQLEISRLSRENRQLKLENIRLTNLLGIPVSNPMGQLTAIEHNHQVTLNNTATIHTTKNLEANPRGIQFYISPPTQPAVAFPTLVQRCTEVLLEDIFKKSVLTRKKIAGFYPDSIGNHIVKFYNYTNIFLSRSIEDKLSYEIMRKLFPNTQEKEVPDFTALRRDQQRQLLVSHLKAPSEPCDNLTTLRSMATADDIFILSFRLWLIKTFGFNFNNNFIRDFVDILAARYKLKIKVKMALHGFNENLPTEFLDALKQELLPNAIEKYIEPQLSKAFDELDEQYTEQHKKRKLGPSKSEAPFNRPNDKLILIFQRACEHGLQNFIERMLKSLPLAWKHFLFTTKLQDFQLYQIKNSNILLLMYECWEQIIIAYPNSKPSYFEYLLYSIFYSLRAKAGDLNILLTKALTVFQGSSRINFLTNVYTGGFDDILKTIYIEKSEAEPGYENFLSLLKSHLTANELQQFQTDSLRVLKNPKNAHPWLRSPELTALEVFMQKNKRDHYQTTTFTPSISLRSR